MVWADDDDAHKNEEEEGVREVVVGVGVE